MSKKLENKIRVGITIGDFNGIGPEVILKTFEDNRLYEYCAPIVYGSTKVLNHYKKLFEMEKPQYSIAKYYNDELELRPKILNVVNCWDEDVEVQPGSESTDAGKYALKAIDDALHDMKEGMFDVLVTAPINKNLIPEKEPKFTGHTEYITKYVEVEESLMLLTSERFKVGLVTNHLPLNEVAGNISKDRILHKLRLLNTTLTQDFGFNHPKIAVFGLNPHAGDNGLLGTEEKDIIAPAIEKARNEGIMAFGPYPADGFMGSGEFQKFDGVLAMYHDQGLVAFKTLNFGSGVNFTAGLPMVRTSPDHGTAYDIAGKNEASADSFRQALYLAIDIFRNRQDYAEIAANPLKRKKMKSE